MSQALDIKDPPPGAARDDWQQHLYGLMDLMAEHPESVEVVEAQMRAHAALRKLDHPGGYGAKERIDERFQEQLYAAGIDRPKGI